MHISLTPWIRQERKLLSHLYSQWVYSPTEEKSKWEITVRYGKFYDASNYKMTAWLIGFKDLFLLFDYMYILVVDPLKLELQVVMSKMMWVLRTKLRFPTEKYTLKC